MLIQLDETFWIHLLEFVLLYYANFYLQCKLLITSSNLTCQLVVGNSLAYFLFYFFTFRGLAFNWNSVYIPVKYHVN